MKIPASTTTLLGLAVVLWAAGASADMVTLTPSKDNSLVQVQSGSTQLSNGQGDIFVGRTAQDGQGPATISIRRGLVKFNIAGAVPQGAVITGASLTMYDVRGLNGSQTVDLHRVLADWGEGSSFFNGGVGGPASDGDATWFSRFYNASDPSASLLWSTPGGDFAPSVSGSAVVTEHTSNVEQAFTWTGAGMLSDIQGWLDNPSTDFGWLIQGNESMGQTAKRLHSREVAGFQPTLSITYTVAAVPEPGSLALACVGGVVLALGRARPNGLPQP